jgi:nicotinate-nucleotide adenylyltransferase
VDAGPLALLGGTFDPPHIGHLFLAECSRAQFSARQVLFLPAGQPYRKAGRPISPAEHRLAMTRLAVAGNPHFAADDREIRRAGPTFTVDTLEELRAEGATDLLLILGLDALADMPNWKAPRRIGELARVAVALKEGHEADLATLATAAALRHVPEAVDMPPLAISGTQIRARVAAGKPIRYLVPPAVADYIEAHRLYGPGEPGSDVPAP